MVRETTCVRQNESHRGVSDGIDLNQRNCGIPDARLNRLEVLKAISSYQTHDPVVRMNEALFNSGSETGQGRCACGFCIDAFFADHSPLPQVHSVIRNHLAASLSLDNFVENLL